MLVNALRVTMVVGILAGAVGLVAGFMHYGLAIFSPPWNSLPKLLQILTIVCPIGIIIGAWLANQRTPIGGMLRPEAGGMLMFIGGVAMIGVVGNSMLAALAGLVGALAGLLALIASDDLKSRATE
jgi:hypothetical protein